MQIQNNFSHLAMKSYVSSSSLLSRGKGDREIRNKKNQKIKKFQASAFYISLLIPALLETPTSCPFLSHLPIPIQQSRLKRWQACLARSSEMYILE